MKPVAPAALALLLAAASAPAQLTHPGCPDLKPADFVQVPLASNATDASVQEPLKMAFGKDADGQTEIYFTQRLGKLRRYSVARKTLVTLADFAFTPTQVPAGRNSWGLIGIALDPAFAQNRWIYVFLGFAREWRIERHRVDGDRVDPSAGKVIYRMDPGPTTGLTHVAGPLRFDAEGNLWASLADNETPHLSANTASPVGKIIRIKPRPFPDAGTPPAPGVGSTYDIPAGNLYPPGTDRTLPEIYIMGVRNPYSLSVDPVRKSVAWGDIGPDVAQTGAGTEELNLASAPGNHGYPYWAGNQHVLEAGHGTPEAPINERAGNTGLRELKPAVAATLPYRRACAIAGPIYRYDPTLPSPNRLPPHLDGKWLVSDFNLSWIDAVSLDAAGKPTARGSLVPTSGSDELDNPLEIEVGPDGILYAINYSGFRTWGPRTGLLRIEYRGSCHPVTATPPAASRGRGPAYRWDGHRLQMEEDGPHAVTLRNAAGAVVKTWSGRGRAGYSPLAGLAPGVHLLDVESASGRTRRKVTAAP